MTTTEIISEFNKNINLDQDYTLVELKSILSDIYKIKKIEEKPKKLGRKAKEPKLNAKGEEKKKREPSEYNLFIKDKYAEFKTMYPTLKAKELMLMASSQWSIKKNETIEATIEAAIKASQQWQEDIMKARTNRIVC